MVNLYQGRTTSGFVVQSSSSEFGIRACPRPGGHLAFRQETSLHHMVTASQRYFVDSDSLIRDKPKWTVVGGRRSVDSGKRKVDSLNVVLRNLTFNFEH